MFSLKGHERAGGNDSNRQLKKLRRQDLLELLVEQLGENEQLMAQVDEAKKANESLSEQIVQLRERLTDKDRKIERLKARLDDKDAVIAQLFEGIQEQVDKKGPISREALLRLSEVVAASFLRQFAPQRDDAIPEADDEASTKDETDE